MIEEKIDALIAALNANTAAHTGKAAPAPDKPAAGKATPTAAAAKHAVDTTTAAAPSVTYAQVKAPFLDAVEKLGRDPALALIAPLTNLKEAKPEQFADLLVKINAALAAHASQTALA